MVKIQKVSEHYAVDISRCIQMLDMNYWDVINVSRCYNCKLPKYVLLKCVLLIFYSGLVLFLFIVFHQLISLPLNCYLAHQPSSLNLVITNLNLVTISLGMEICWTITSFSLICYYYLPRSLLLQRSILAQNNFSKKFSFHFLRILWSIAQHTIIIF